MRIANETLSSNNKPNKANPNKVRIYFETLETKTPDGWTVKQYRVHTEESNRWDYKLYRSFSNIDEAYMCVGKVMDELRQGLKPNEIEVYFI